MELGSLLPNLQETANFVRPVPEKSSPRPSILTLILFFFLSLSHPVDLFPLGFPTKSMHTFLLPFTCAACPSHVPHALQMCRIPFTCAACPSRLILMYEIA